MASGMIVRYGWWHSTYHQSFLRSRPKAYQISVYNLGYAAPGKFVPVCNYPPEVIPMPHAISLLALDRFQWYRLGDLWLAVRGGELAIRQYSRPTSPMKNRALGVLYTLAKHIHLVLRNHSTDAKQKTTTGRRQFNIRRVSNNNLNSQPNENLNNAQSLLGAAS
jgi:hypothetical protein